MTCETATLWLAIATFVATAVIAITGIVYTIATVRLWRTTRDALKLTLLELYAPPPIRGPFGTTFRPGYRDMLKSAFPDLVKDLENLPPAPSG